MPSSAIESVPYIVEFLRKNRPKLTSVLDVGMGFGKGAFLVREYFDMKTYGLFQPKEWRVKITGVDIYEGYVSHLQKLLYNEIVIGDIFEVLPSLGKFEVAILSDVIEHFEREKGLVLLHRLFGKVEDIVIATPNGFLAHEAKGENKHEAHLSGWTVDDFQSFTIVEKAVVKRINKKDEGVLVVYLRP